MMGAPIKINAISLCQDKCAKFGRYTVCVDINWQ